MRRKGWSRRCTKRRGPVSPSTGNSRAKRHARSSVTTETTSNGQRPSNRVPPGRRKAGEQDKKIADTEAALKSAKDINSEDKTTDVNPEWLSLNTSANTLRQQQAGLNSRRAELSGQLSHQRGDIGKMERASIEIGELDREIKELESSLELYRNKAISAGIAEDLDAAKISNVVVASPPIVPVL